MKALLFLPFLFLGACAHVNSLSVTSIPANRSQPISAEASRVIFLGFNFDNDYVDSLVDKLRAKCPNGKISGILTKDVSINYFLYIVHKREVTASGYCEPYKTTAMTTPKSPAERKVNSVTTESEPNPEL